MKPRSLPLSHSGFTLVELAIVLVIVGLIIGGILVGADLTRAAEIRALASQIETYNAGVNTFRTKHGGLPGDLRNVDEFPGMLTDLPGNGTGQGDGNRMLESAGGGMLNLNGELTLFWQHMAEAGVIPGPYNGAQTGAVVNTSFPIAKINRQGVGVYGVNGVNYYQIGQANAAVAVNVYANALTTMESFDLDQKLDDAMPNTGQTIARGNTTPNASATTTATGCMTGTAETDTYRTTHNEIACQLRLRMQQ